MNKLNIIIDAIKEVSKELDIHPNLVTKAQIKKCKKYKVSEWMIKQIPGGLSAVKSAHFPVTTKELVVAKKIKDTSKYIRDLEKQLADKLSLEEEIKSAIINKIKPVKVKQYKSTKKKNKKSRDIVAMLNDTHIGLQVKPEEVDYLNSFNFEIASRRVAFFTKEVCEYKIDKRDQVDTLHLILNGDLIAGIIHGLMSKDLELLTHQVNAAVHIFANCVSRCAENFKKVKVYFSTGNHGDSPHRREGGRVSAQIYDSIEGQIFYAISAAHKDTKNVEFVAGHSLSQDINLPAGRAIATHGHLMFSRQLGNPGTSVNTKLLGQAISDLNESERRLNREEVKLVLLGHTHCYFDIIAKNGVRVLNAPSLSGIDSYAFSIGIRNNLTGQVVFESTKDHIIGDLRLIKVQEADSNPEMDKIITPYNYELTFKK